MLKTSVVAIATLVSLGLFATPASAQYRGDNAYQVYRATLDSHPSRERYLSANCFERGASVAPRCPEGYQYLEPATLGSGNGRITNLPADYDGYRGRSYNSRGYGGYYGGQPYGYNYGIGVSAGVGVNLGGYGYGYGYPYSNETSLGRTKKEKHPENRYQYCGEGIGWVRFGVSCASQARGPAYALGQAPTLSHTPPVAPIAVEKTAAASRVFTGNLFVDGVQLSCYTDSSTGKSSCESQ